MAPEAAEHLLTVLHGSRWSLTGSGGDAGLFERRFAREFAAYTQTRFCVPVDHGSSALVVALEALGLQAGDRVLVPALTWVASASAALRAGLVPVLVDVDRATGCIAPGTMDLEVDARAVVVVHWSCAMADVPAITAVADRHDMTVIEDCAQAHGARWLGRPAGSLGRMGCFSMQQGKVLTCGEGGAVVTDDETLAPRLEELRADSRRYGAVGSRHQSELVETASVMGVNFCLSEFQAAVLCAQLGVLEAQHAQRARSYSLLLKLIADLRGVRLLRPPPEQDGMSIYELPIVFERLPTGMDAQLVADALTAELGTRFYRSDTPLHRSRLLCPESKPALAPLSREFVERQKSRSFPAADFFIDNAVVTHHSTLLGDERDMADIATALGKLAALIPGG